MRFFAAALVITLGVPALAQHKQPEAVTQACKAVEGLPAPKTATIPPPMSKSGMECDPLELYYGLSGRPDYAAAKRCALAEWNNATLPDPQEGQMTIFATGTLAMMYANGVGTPRNVDQAIRIACVDDSASSNDEWNDDLVMELLKVKANPKHRVDFCSVGVFNDRGYGYECTGIGEALEENKHKAPLKRAMASWTPPQKAAYAKMMKARDAFVEAEVPADPDVTGGTGVGAEMMETESRMRIELIDAMVRYELGHLPRFSHEDFLTADKDLNRRNAKTISDLTVSEDEYSKSPKVLRDSERAWIAYRDAWLDFAKVRWPQVSTDSWLTLLTKERTDQIKSME